MGVSSPAVEVSAVPMHMVCCVLLPYGIAVPVEVSAVPMHMVCCVLLPYGIVVPVEVQCCANANGKIYIPVAKYCM